jgi:hypothetical protein
VTIELHVPFRTNAGIIVAEDSGAPVESDAVQRSATDLQVAAVAFATQLAISEGHDPKVIMLTRQRAS